MTERDTRIKPTKHVLDYVDDHPNDGDDDRENNYERGRV